MILPGISAAGLGHALAGYRNVFTVVSGLTVLQAAMTALAIVVALRLREAGVSSAVLGVVASSFTAGLLIGALISPREIARIGHIRSFALFAALASIGVMGLALGVDVVAWSVIQVLLGVCCAGLLAAGESWVADAAPAQQRGAILAFYHLVAKLGAIAGPFLIAGAATANVSYMIIAALFAAALLPITATNRSQPTLSTSKPFGPLRIWRLAPAAAYSAFTAGAVNNAVAQLYPVFAAAQTDGPSTQFAAQFNAAILIGAMIGLWPAGALSDRIDRRLVIGGLGIIAVAASAGLVAIGPIGRHDLLLGVGVIFGIGALSHYSVAVAHAADRSNPEDTTPVMAGILVVWGLGSVAGPIAAGWIMSTALGPSGLFVFAAVAMAVLTMSMFTRAHRAEAVPDEDKDPFEVVSATSFAMAEFDPRGSEVQLDLFADEAEAASEAPDTGGPAT